MSRVWFITGSSRGFGREFALAALERGDQVAATARDTGKAAWQRISVRVRSLRFRYRRCDRRRVVRR